MLEIQVNKAGFKAIFNNFVTGAVYFREQFYSYCVIVDYNSDHRYCLLNILYTGEVTNVFELNLLHLFDFDFKNPKVINIEHLENNVFVVYYDKFCFAIDIITKQMHFLFAG